MRKPPSPNHVPGTARGEEMALKHREPGRMNRGKYYRTSRDSTGINPEQKAPIDPSMPHLPPA